MMFGFFKKIFIELLRGSIIRRFSESLGHNSEKPINIILYTIENAKQNNT